MYYTRNYRFVCDSSFCSRSVPHDVFPSLADARCAGWIVARSGKCYCPSCAPYYRHVGRSGRPRSYVQE